MQKQASPPVSEREDRLKPREMEVAAQMGCAKAQSLVPRISTVIAERWDLKMLLGAGSFGQVFLVLDRKQSNRKEALKIEIRCLKKKREALRMEIHVLRKMQGKTIHVAEFIGCGSVDRQEGVFTYLVMELLSRNLSDLRRESPYHRFSHGTALQMTIQALEAIKCIHEGGIVHRDVKPSNFALGMVNRIRRRTLIALDFGLARVYINPDTKKPRPPREYAGFRGSFRYASIRVHDGKEQCPGDDLYSLWFMCVELCKGSLPWGKEKDNKDKIRAMKIRAEQDKFETLCDVLPPNLRELGKQLSVYQYETVPDYTGILGQLHAALHSIHLTDDSPYDWEVNYTTVKNEQNELYTNKKIQRSTKV